MWTPTRQDDRPTPGTKTRRQALRALVGGGAALLGLAAAACSSSTPTTGSGQSQPAATSAPAVVPAASASPVRASSSPSPSPSGQVATTADWNTLVAAAQKEGQVVVSGPPDPGADTQIPAAFKQAYGIDVQYLSVASAQVATRVQSERAAGQYTLDVMLGGSDTVYGTVYTNGWLDDLAAALILPEVTDGSVWITGAPWFRDPGGNQILQVLNSIAPVPITINTQMVSPDDVKSVTSLLDPQWAGKIGAFDPGANGPGIATASTIYLNKGQDFASSLYKGQQVALSRDFKQPSDWVAHGSYPIVLAAAHAFNLPYLQDNLPLLETSFDDIPAALAGSFGLVTLFNNAPHPNAARVFVNWVASRDGLALFAQLDSSAPVRNDIQVTWLPPDQVPQPGGQYFDTYDYQFASTTRLQIRDFFNNLLQ